MSPTTLITSPCPGHSPMPVIRYGEPADVPAVVAMHDRCSPDSLARRFHSAQSGVSERVARMLLMPDLGWSLVAEQEGRVVGLACGAALSTYTLELGLLVEDECRGRGIGAALVRAMSEEASRRGYLSMSCVTQPENCGVTGAIVAAGLRPTESLRDGLLEIEVPLGHHHEGGHAAG